MQKLKNMVNKYLDNFEYPEVNPEYVKAIDYVKENNNKPFDEIVPQHYSIFELCLIAAEIDDIYQDYDELKALMKRCHEFFEVANLESTFDIDFYYYYFYDLQVIYFYDKFGPDNEFDLTEEDRKKAQESYDTNNRYLMKEIFSDKEDQKPIEAIKDLYYTLPNMVVFLQFLDYEKARQIVKQSKDNELLEDLQNFASIYVRKGEVSRALKKSLNKIMKKADINIDENYAKIINFYDKVSTEVKQVTKRLNKNKRNYQRIINDLEYHKNSYIEIDKKDLEFLQEDNPDILNEYLLYIVKHNTIFNTEIQNQNEELNNTIPSALELLMEMQFNKFNYNLNELDDNYLMELSKVNNLEEKLSFVSRSSLSYLKPNNKLFLLIISNLSLDNIKFINHLLDNKIIDRNFLNIHAHLIENKEQFVNFKANIEVLMEYNISNISKYNSDILLIDNDLIVKRLNLITNKYKIPLKDVYNYEFLENDQVFDLLDNFIELGYYNQIKNNPNYLTTNNFIMIKRLIVAQMIGYPVIDNNNSFIGSITTGKDFYVSNQDLDSFIIDYTSDYTDIDIEGSRIDINGSDLQNTVPLLDYEYDEVSYMINDKLISKNRVLRNIHQLKENNNETLFNALLYKSINLDEDTIHKISKISGHKIKKL